MVAEKNNGGASMEPCLFRHGKETKRILETRIPRASMEPCLFRHGKSEKGRQNSKNTGKLQWSHVFSDMVSRRYNGQSEQSHAASMEPCLFRHGKRRAFSISGLYSPASMEPCLFRHGKDSEAALATAIGKLASMEPCLFRHGKPTEPTDDQKTEAGLQWSHVFSDMVR